MTQPTDDATAYPVDLPDDVIEEYCAAYERALADELTARIVVPDDLTTHAEVRALRVLLPRLLRDELLRHVDVAFPDGEEPDGYHYALERLFESVMARVTELDRWVVAQERATAQLTTDLTKEPTDETD